MARYSVFIMFKVSAMYILARSTSSSVYLPRISERFIVYRHNLFHVTHLENVCKIFFYANGLKILLKRNKNDRTL